MLRDKIETQNQLQKILKVKQIGITRLRTKINTNTNYQDTFHFWKVRQEK